jgi:thioesterase domain-containing protein
VLPIQTGGSRQPFFFLHGQWEEQLAFHCYPLAQALGSDQPFYGMDPYLLDGREGLPTLEDIAAAHIKLMRNIQPEGPYFLGGWCNGALIAYEMARQLQAAGQAVDLLVLMDPEYIVYPLSFRLYRGIFTLAGRLLRLKQRKKLEWYLGLKYILRSLRFKLLRKQDAGKLPWSALLQNYPRLWDWVALEYAPSSIYDGKITFFWTEGENEGKVERPSRKSWRKVEVRDQVEIHIVPGDHITSRTVYLPVLARHLDSCLRKAQKATQ